MFKFFIAIKKELIQLLADKVGLFFMFALPIVLVMIMTIIQDSAYKLVNENKISLLVNNMDEGAASKKLLAFIDESGLFEMTVDNAIERDMLAKELLNRKVLVALQIPPNFSEHLSQKAAGLSSEMLSELDLGIESDLKEKIKPTGNAKLKFYHDPVLRDNYTMSLMSIISSFLELIENGLMIENLYAEMGIEKSMDGFKDEFEKNKVKIEKIAASVSSKSPTPNSSQHNVPAWTIFAMFFMVVSLGSNIVKEKLNGSFLRMRTMPTSFFMVLTSKMFVYIMVALLQLAVIFSIGIFIFPYMGLPQLILPNNPFLFLCVVLLSAFAAVSFAIMIGSLTKTIEQANGIGAVSVIIFAALGGIWVPVFVMPGFMQTLSNLSPMKWCLEGFYNLFLKGGNWADLFPVMLVLILFILICQGISYISLKRENLI